MKVEQAYDKVVLSHEEVQTALKEYIAKHMPGRVVRGDIVTNGAPQRSPALTPIGQVANPRGFNLDLAKALSNINKAEPEKSKPYVTTTAHLYLEPVEHSVENGKITLHGVVISKTIDPAHLVAQSIEGTLTGLAEAEAKRIADKRANSGRTDIGGTDNRDITGYGPY